MRITGMTKVGRAVMLCAVWLSVGSMVKSAAAETLLGDFLKEKNIPLTVSATLDTYDKYVWRGFLLDKDIVLQPGVTLSCAGFSGGFWGSWDMEGKDSLDSDETDGWIGYSHDLGFVNETLSKVSVSVGHTWYGFPDADLYAKETYLGVALSTFLSPSFTWYHDYSKEENGGAKGDYYIFALAHSITVNEKYGITVDMGGNLGLNQDYFITGNGGYTLATLGVTLPLTPSLKMSPKIGYSVPFGDLTKESGGNPQKEQFYGGVSLAMSF
jgi:hypothetical protein